MTVEVTQYMRPRGNLVQQFTEVSDDCRTAYEEIIKRGWNLAAEVLMTDMVSLTIEDNEEGKDMAIRVVPNGPKVTEAIEEMLKQCSSKT